MTRKPKVGDTIYTVLEHLYYPDGGSYLIQQEYVVCEGTVKAVIEFDNSRKPECRVTFNGPEPNGTTLMYPRFPEFGKRFFFDREDAIVLAEKMTDDYERRWSWTGEVLRRPWREETQDEH